MRKQVSPEIVDSVGDDMKMSVIHRLEQKGYGGFASIHEILGIIAEEYKELIDAVQANDIEGVMNELKDIGVACHFGIASRRADTLDW